MTRFKLMVLAALMLALLSDPAAGMKLLVNGSAPSIRYQGWVDAMLVPTPDIAVDLRVSGDAHAVLEACREEGGACVYYTEPMPTIFIPVESGTNRSPSDQWYTPFQHRLLRLNTLQALSRGMLYHEIGHLVDRYLMAESDRSRFLMLTGLDGREWRSPPNSPHELFADFVALCAWDRAHRLAFFWTFDSYDKPEKQYGLGYADRTYSEREIRGVCGMIRAL